VSGDHARTITALLAQARGNPQQWLQLIFFLLVVSGSFLSWLFKQLQAKAEQKRRMDAAESRKIESLRTGRGLEASAPAAPPSTSGPTAGPRAGPPADRQRELAARRQAQLQELRRRQLERAQGAPAPGRPPEPRRQTPLIIIPGSTGPIVVERKAAPRPAPPAPPERRQPPREAPRHPATVAAPRAAQPERPKRQRGARQRAQPAPSQAIDREQFTHISQAAPPLEVSRGGTPSPVTPGAPRTAEDWRRAIMAREILGRPLAERPIDPWETPVF
jgi:hypothetical protein